MQSLGLLAGQWTLAILFLTSFPVKSSSENVQEYRMGEGKNCGKMDEDRISFFIALGTELCLLTVYNVDHYYILSFYYIKKISYNLITQGAPLNMA